MSVIGSRFRPFFFFEFDPWMPAVEPTCDEVDLLSDINAGRALVATDISSPNIPDDRVTVLPDHVDETNYYDRIWALLGAAAYAGYDTRAMVEGALRAQESTWRSALHAAGERDERTRR